MSRYIYFLIFSVIALTSVSVMFNPTMREFHLLTMAAFIIGAIGAIYHTIQMSKEEDDE